MQARTEIEEAVSRAADDNAAVSGKLSECEQKLSEALQEVSDLRENQAQAADASDKSQQQILDELKAAQQDMQVRASHSSSLCFNWNDKKGPATPEAAISSQPGSIRNHLNGTTAP